MATWTKLLQGTARTTCASDSCPDIPATWYMEAGGTGSYFCDACHDNLVSKELRQPARSKQITEALDQIDCAVEEVRVLLRGIEADATEARDMMALGSAFHAITICERSAADVAASVGRMLSTTVR